MAFAVHDGCVRPTLIHCHGSGMWIKKYGQGDTPVHCRTRAAEFARQHPLRTRDRLGAITKGKGSGIA